MFPIPIISLYGNIAPKDEYSFYIQPNEDINSTEVIETKNKFLFYRRSGSGSVQYNDKLGKSLYLPSGTSFYNASTGESQISLDFNNNFEISFRANILSQGSDYNVLFCRYNNNSNSGSWIVAISNPGYNGYRKLEFSYTTDGTSNTLQRVISSTEFTFNTEVEIIIRRIGSTLVMYQNGIR